MQSDQVYFSSKRTFINVRKQNETCILNLYLSKRALCCSCAPAHQLLLHRWRLNRLVVSFQNRNRMDGYSPLASRKFACQERESVHRTLPAAKRFLWQRGHQSCPILLMWATRILCIKYLEHQESETGLFLAFWYQSNLPISRICCGVLLIGFAISDSRILNLT